MACSSLPSCSRCSQPACDHLSQPPENERPYPSIPGVCIGYIGFPDCVNCGHTTWEHEEHSPHEIDGVCGGYEWPENATPYEGQGGGFGGGGATGGW